MTQPDEGLYNVTVKVNDLEAIYESVNTYEFTSERSPVILSVSPLNISDPTQLILKGRNFVTNQSEIKIKIGAEICEVLSSNLTDIKCLLNGLNLGSQKIDLNIQSKHC